MYFKRFSSVWQMTLSLPPHCLDSIKTSMQGLILVATPIGNLSDISLRGLLTLQQADMIACEDTRVTRKLLDHYGIQAKLQSYHDHNAGKIQPLLIHHLKQGHSLALVCDSGTPLISDPGYKLVQAAITEGISVQTIPGASALLTGLVISGLPTHQFLFAGFPPPRSVARQKFLQAFSSISATLVFFESPQRLQDSLKDCLTVFGNKPAAVGRELTKMFEEIKRGDLQDLVDYYQGNPLVKGEIVVMIDLTKPLILSPEEKEDLVANLLQQYLPLMSVKEAAKKISDELDIPKKIVYNQALILQKK